MTQSAQWHFSKKKENNDSIFYSIVLNLYLYDRKKELARLNPRHLPYWLYKVWIIILAPNFKWVYFILKTTVVICFHDSREAESWPDLEAGWDEGSNAEVGSNILNSVQWGYKVKDWRVCYKLIL